MTDFHSQLDGFFSGLAPEEKERLLAGQGLWKKQTLAPGTVVFEEGANSNELYLILSGRIEIAKHFGSGQKKVLAVLEPGAIFGEGALLSNKPRSASATAVDSVEALMLSKEAFDQFTVERPAETSALLLGLLKVVNQRLQWTNQELIALYDVSQIVGEHRNDTPGLLKEVGEKLAQVTGASQGLIGVRNRSTGLVEPQFQWGEFSLETKILTDYANQYVEKRWGDLEGNRLVVSITDASGKLLGVMVLDHTDPWTRNGKRIVHAVMEQLGMAMAALQSKENEHCRTMLKQETVQF